MEKVRINQKSRLSDARLSGIYSICRYVCLCFLVHETLHGVYHMRMHLCVCARTYVKHLFQYESSNRYNDGKLRMTLIWGMDSTIKTLLRCISADFCRINITLHSIIDLWATFDQVIINHNILLMSRYFY